MSIINIVLTILSFIGRRSTEPSTHAGLAGILMAVRPFVPPLYQPLIDPLAALLSGLAVIISEKGNKAPVVELSKPAS